MSAKKRRAKRKIAQLVRMDQTRMRMQPYSFLVDVLGGRQRQRDFFLGCMVPLGKRLARMGLKARTKAALQAAGTDLS